MTARLNVNIDHVATIARARRAPEPSVVAAAMACEQAGADGITIHLRGDRRHIQESDLHLLRVSVTTYLNVEMAATDEMLGIAIEARPDAVTLVAENPEEITTEGGLDVRSNLSIVRSAVDGLNEAGIVTSLFIDPNDEQVEAAHKVSAQQVELCTSVYSDLTSGANISHPSGELLIRNELDRIKQAAALARRLGLRIAAGHGLTYRNVHNVALIGEITEFNIGHNIVARSVFVGLANAVREMRMAIAGDVW